MTTDLKYSVSYHGMEAILGFSVSSSAGDPVSWQQKDGDTRWESFSHGLFCEVVLRHHDDDTIYELRVTNQGSSPVDIHHLKLGPEMIRWQGGLRAPHALYSLHPRVTGVNDYDADEVLGLPPLAELPANEWHELSERCPELPHLEALILTDGWDSPSFVEGPLTQNHAHQRKKVKWRGEGEIQFESVHRFMGIPSRALAPGETLSESGFIQFRPDGDLNNSLRDYLRELTKATGTRGQSNPLIDERYFCTWNNFLYWEANQEEVLSSVKAVKETLPAIQWYVLDDSYAVSEGASSRLERNSENGRIHDLEKELPWFHNMPGVTFLFDDGEGVDYGKFPDGLDGFVQKVKGIGLRPAIWIGMETSRHAAVAIKHPDWFIDIGHESHLLLDLSVPEVREQLVKAFRILFVDWGFEAVKIDFSTHLTDHPGLNYRYSGKSGAEWRTWFYRTVREYLPEDGFISLACWLCMGSPWVTPWVDSYRDSMDARDGNWQTVLNNVRWSILPALSGGSGQPIPNADSISVFKGVEKEAMQTWVNYARVGSMVIEASGDVSIWSDQELSNVNECLADGQSGGRIYFADKQFWSRDGLPCANYRALNDDGYLLGLYNWKDEASTVTPDWTGPISECKTFTSLRTGEPITRDELSNFHLPARGSALFRAV